MGGASSTALGKKSSAHEVVAHFAKLANVDASALLTGKVAAVTGANVGLGLETTKALVAAGCRVIAGSRDVAAGRAALDKELTSPGHGKYAIDGARVAALTSVVALNLEDPASIRGFAAAVAAEPRLDFLILNAGIMALPKLERTPLGFEKQIGVNHLGHFALTAALRAKMVAQTDPSRIVVLSSTAHTMGSVLVDDLHFTGTARTYAPWVAYGQSKMANILFAKELADQLAGSSVTALSLHPGVIHTNLVRHIPFVSGGGFGGFIFDALVTDKTIPQGAATTLAACLDPALREHAGAYLSDCALKTPNAEGVDADKAKRKALWAATVEQLTKAGVDLSPVAAPAPPQ